MKNKSKSEAPKKHQPDASQDGSGRRQLGASRDGELKLTQFRQGDVLVEKIKNPVNQTTINGPVILAHGEVTGHAHQIHEPEAASLLEIDWKGQKAMGLNVKRITKVEHQEHASIPLEEGAYRVIRQREYSPEAIRNVAD